MTQFGICNLSVIPLRAEASDRSEILSQLIFGDRFQILEQTEKWTYIETLADQYKGWIDHKQYVAVAEEEYINQQGLKILGLSPAHKIIKQATGEVLYLPSGCSIPPVSGDNEFLLGNQNYTFTDTPVWADRYDFDADIEHVAKFFLQTPYLWGGRTLFGIDCSGFSQIVYKMLGVNIKRDAWQQAEEGETVHFLQEVRRGDLAFFDNSEGRIIHVGIMLNDQQIIHASGRVKIDPIDDEGIYSLDLKKHTHKLRIIKRFV